MQQTHKHHPIAEFHTVDENDLIPVSKFSKYDAHLVTSNDGLIVYTTSKKGVVRIINQKTSQHFVLATRVRDTITDLKLIVNPSHTSDSVLLVGSRNSGIFTFWSISNDTVETPAILTYEVYEVPSDVTFDFYHSEDGVCIAATNDDTVFIIEIPQEYTSQHNSPTVDGLKSRIDLASTVAFVFLEGPTFEIPVYANKAHGFAITSDCRSVGWLESTDASHDQFATCVSKAGVVSQPSENDGSTISKLVRDGHVVLEKAVHSIPSVIGRFSLPKNPTLNKGSLDYFIVGYDSKLTVYPYLKGLHKSITIDLPNGFTVENISIERIEDISLVMVFCSALEQVALVKFRRYGVSENIDDFDYSVQIIKFPSEYSVLSCSIWASVEEVEKFKGHHAVDIYIYHTKGIVIAPCSLGPRPDYSKDVVTSIPKPSSTTEAPTSSNDKSSATTDQTLSLLSKIELFAKSYVENYVVNENYSKLQEEDIFDFLESSDLVRVISRKVKEELLREILNSNSFLRVCEMKNKGSLSETVAFNLLNDAIEESMFGSGKTFEETQPSSESFQSVAVANPNYKLEKGDYAANTVQTSSESEEGWIGDNFDEEKSSDKEEKNGSTHILPALFDSLEKASSSEPMNVPSAYQFSSVAPGFTQQVSQPAFGSQNSNAFNSFVQSGNSANPPQVPPGLGFGMFQQPNVSRESNGSIPGTTLGHGKPHAQIWGAPAATSSLGAVGNSISIPQPDWPKPSTIQPQSLVSPSQYPQTSSISQLPSSMSHLSLKSPQGPQQVNSYPSSAHHQPSQSIGYPDPAIISQVNSSQGQSTRMPSVSHYIGSSSSQNEISNTLPEPQPPAHLGSYEPKQPLEPQPQKAYPFLTVKSVSSHELTNFEIHLVKVLLSQGPMSAFVTIRASQPAADVGSDQRSADLGKILSSYAFVVLTSPPGLDQKGLMDVVDAYASNDVKSLLFSMQHEQPTSLSITKQEAQNVLKRLFQGDVNFLLLLGYAVYLISPAFTFQRNLPTENGNSKVNGDSNDIFTGSCQRLNWVITLLTYVHTLITEESASVTDALSIERIQRTRESWVNNKSLLETTFNRIKEDGSELGAAFCNYAIDPVQRHFFAKQLDELFSILELLNKK